MSLLKQNTTEKGRVDKNLTKLAELDAGNDSSKYEIKVIWNRIIYIKE